ncbi:hypothetical protein ZWY2020_032470 [Hordeum vulgare]|nr:hypothetical protein ZWY2020_032470 [Hordeum vulgare]
MAAGLTPSVNLFALLDSNDPGDGLVADFGSADGKQEAPAAKHKKTPTASHTKDLLGQAFPSARDYVIRKQQLERQARARAKAKAEAEAMVKTKAKNGDEYDKSVGASVDGSKVHDGAKRDRYYNNNNNNNKNNNNNNGAYRNRQFGMSGKFETPKRQQPGVSMNEAAPPKGVEAPPAPQKAPPPPPPPSLDDISEFPSLH